MRTDKLKVIPLQKVKEGERFRVNYGGDAFDQLVESIKEKGVLQPITVAAEKDGGYRLLAGGRRLRACQRIGLKDIPALIRESDGEIDDREVELVENVFRLDMHWAERDKLIARIDGLCREKNIEWSGRKTAQLLGQGVTTVARSLQLAKAIELMPELAKQETQQQAEKLLKSLEEQHIVQELRNRQQAQMAAPTSAMDKGLAHMLKVADANYKVGDTFKGMAELKTNSFIHLIECDPPYGIDLNEQKRGNEEVTSNVKTYNEVPRDEYKAFLQKLAKEMFRVAYEHSWLVFWYGPTWHTEVKEALIGAGWKVDDIPAIWNKRTGQTMQPGFNLARAYEPFFLARKGSPAIIKQGRANVFDFPPTAGQKKYHPTERPLPLMEAILETLVATRSNIFVPFLGSGVTLRACYKLGLTGWGYDLNGEYKDKFMLAVEQDTKDLDKDDDESED